MEKNERNDRRYKAKNQLEFKFGNEVSYQGYEIIEHSYETVGKIWKHFSIFHII